MTTKSEDTSVAVSFVDVPIMKWHGFQNYIYELHVVKERSQWLLIPLYVDDEMD